MSDPTPKPLTLEDLPKNVRLREIIRKIPKDLSALINPSCKKCNGKGFTGVNVQTREKTLCTSKRCLIENLIAYQA